jgi:predicted Zn-dependent protease
MNLDALEEQVLGHARREMGPTPADSRRVRAAVLAQIGAATLGQAAGASAAGGWFASLGPIKTALVVAAATGGVSTLAGLYWRAHEPPRRVAPSATTAEAPVAPALESRKPATSADEVSPLASSSPREPRTKSSGPLPSAASSEEQRNRLAEEVWLLKRADQALRNGAPDVARSLLDELATTNPNGQLLEERAAAQTLILCQRERGGAAQAAAEEFLAAHPASVYAARIRAACLDSTVKSEGTPDSRTLRR